MRGAAPRSVAHSDAQGHPVQLALWPPDWRDQEPYRSEVRDGRPTTCPAVWEGRKYVGGLVEGAPRYEGDA